ncbi:putative entry exclusion protein TrbK-alt [uncultured Tateyamaria sp.]|uniref:putative entry exclusion protein TrbK-alt n=1 Tax=uncultured Tateyamaria sp. TaxID=455651 RepID=UPI00262647EA|nr:putative entry exclusion protein TrbK-alt [uncultured Tateyamaria sp.]
MKLTAEATLKGIAIAMGAGAALMVAIEFQTALEIERTERPASVIPDDPLRAKLQRCRTLTPETDTTCQEAWEENRRHFFGLTPDDQDRE